MLKDRIVIRPRYGEVDKMGYIYHGNYIKYFHQARTEMMRKYGIDDDTLEKQNILLPVIEMNIKYLRPSFYDSILTIETAIGSLPVTRFKFAFSVFNEKNDLVCKAESTLVFVNSNSRKPIRVPSIVKKSLKNFFEE